MVLSERWFVSDAELQEQIEALQREEEARKAAAMTSGPARQRTGALTARATMQGPVYMDRLHLVDTIPCPSSGRKAVGAGSNDIRIYVSLPGIGASLSIWVDPDLPISPPSITSRRDGIGAGGRAAPFPSAAADAVPEELRSSRGLAAAGRSLLAAERATPGPADAGGPSTTCVSSLTASSVTLFSTSLRPSRVPVEVSICSSLQELLETFLEIPVASQQLRLGAGRLDLESALTRCTLREWNVHHGSTIILTRVNARPEDTKRLLEVLRQRAKENCTGEPRVKLRWVNQHTPNVLGDSKASAINSSVQFHDYAHSLSDSRQANPCGDIRRAHMWS